MQWRLGTVQIVSLSVLVVSTSIRHYNYNEAESDVVTYWTSLAGPAQPVDGPEYSLIPELN